MTFCSCGDTIEEALESLQELKKELFIDFIKRGIHIPKPVDLDDDFCGLIQLHVSKKFHKKLLNSRHNPILINFNDHLVDLLKKGLSL